MKKKKLIPIVIAMLALLVILDACDDDDPPTKECTTFTVADSVCFCTANPTDANCMPAVAECPTFTVADSVCFCKDNPTDANCIPPVVYDRDQLNGLGVIMDFEDVGDSLAWVFRADFFAPSGKLGVSDATDIAAYQGDKFMRLITTASDTGKVRNFHDFKYWPSAWDDDAGNDTDAKIDFTDLTDPHINFWVNTGTANAGLGIMFQTALAGGGNREWIFEHAIEFGSTDNTWKLFSLSISALYNNTDGLICCNNPVPDLDLTHQMIKFFVIPKNLGATVNASADPKVVLADPQDYVLRLDEVSITDGPAPTATIVAPYNKPN